MLKPLVLFSALLLCEFPVAAQRSQKSEPSSYYTIPVEAARRPNPVKATPESIERGKTRYGYDCAMCHGKDGAGKGEVAKNMKLKISNFTDAEALQNRTDGELFYVIRNGKNRMPPEGDRVKAEDIWDLVNYIRSFSNKASTSAP